MGGSYSCLLCLGDDALGDKKDTGTKHRDAWSWIDDSCLAGCLDDSDVERVFVTEAKRNKFVVVGLGGASVRKEAQLDSLFMSVLPRGTMVVVSEIRGQRAHLIAPFNGWASLSTEEGYEIIQPTKRSTRYRVIFEEGIFVRTGSRIEGGRIVRIAPCGTILRATGKTKIVDGVERVQVEDGWVSMRLREDKGEGERLLEALN
eukprot:jgi/Undpi1/11551/HiC_scaffold_30.g13848.m1